jgi:serine protease Do
VDEESKPTPEAEAEVPAAPPARFTPPRSWQRRGNWIMLGRVLGGFGAFIAAIIAAVQFAFGGGGGGATGTVATEPTSANEPYAYAERHDDSGTISVEVPTAWGNIDGRRWRSNSIGSLPDGTPLGVRLIASPNVSAWGAAGELATPGVFVGVSDVIQTQWKTARDVAKAFNYEGCEFASDVPYTRGGLTGWEVRSTCGDSNTRWVTLAASSSAVPGALVFVQAKLVTPKDDEAYQRVLGSLVVRPS